MKSFHQFNFCSISYLQFSNCYSLIWKVSFVDDDDMIWIPPACASIMKWLKCHREGTWGWGCNCQLSLCPWLMTVRGWFVPFYPNYLSPWETHLLLTEDSKDGVHWTMIHHAVVNYSSETNMCWDSPSLRAGIHTIWPEILSAPYRIFIVHWHPIRMQNQ